ncbi:MAG: DUF1592 domain-containing protein [Rhodopirellula sp.]|nr:DUF1592 domain-containing protein [Rhodopirellula sp.]
MPALTATSSYSFITRRVLHSALAFIIVVISDSPPGVAQADTPLAITQQNYQTTVQPLLKKFCFECHAAETTEAEVDLGKFSTIESMTRQTKVWIKIREMFDTRQMPPKDSPQPTETEHRLLAAWVKAFLLTEAKKHAGDPGPVILRRLSNDEYNYTVQDLTGVTSLNPTREFPVDGAAGEGFTNSGAAQSMSPALVTKFLDAGKDVASHAVLTPDGIRFSPSTSRRDHTDELLARIQQFYRPFTEDSGNTSVTLQGIKLSTSDGGRLPVSRYIEATLQERDALQHGTTSLATVAQQRSLNEKYLTTLWNVLHTQGDSPSLLLDGLREAWTNSTADGAAKLASDIDAAQNSLWKFNSIGQSGREGGATAWQEAVSSLTTRHELRHKISTDVDDSDVVLWLTVNDLGDGNAADFVVLERPRFEFPTVEGSEPLPPIDLRHIRSFVSGIEATIAREIPRTADYLVATAQLRTSTTTLDDTAKMRGLNPALLKRWASLLGLGYRANREITGHFTTKLEKGQGYDAINGWGSNATPNMLTNRSAEPISFLTLTVPARGVTVHPSPTHESTVAWKSPVDANIRVEGLVADADGVCGNGAAWRVELLSESGSSLLAEGVFDNGGRQTFHPETPVPIRTGDVVSLIVNPRDGSHACDSTHIELKLTSDEQSPRVWNLATDVVDRILESNPLPDSFGNAGTWHFGSQPITPNEAKQASLLVVGSSLAKFRAAALDGRSDDELNKLALSIQASLETTDPTKLSEADRAQREQLLNWRGPLRWTVCSVNASSETSDSFGLDPDTFGKHPNGSVLPDTDLCLKAPQILEIRLPSKLVAGSEFVTTGKLHATTAGEGTAQIQVAATKPSRPVLSISAPILVGEQARPRVEAALDEFRQLFPEALCYARIVPVDEVVTLKLFYREDDYLQRLMLDDDQSAQLDRLWDELFFVAQEPLQLAVSYEQLYEFATQDRPDIVKALESLRKPLNERADRFRERMRQTEPTHVDAVLQFADRAWRRSLSGHERSELQTLYARLREVGVDHDGAIQLTLARVLASPSFLYRREEVGPGATPSPVSNDELATRLSYFLWSSLPDEELRTSLHAAGLSGRGGEHELLRQTHRLLKDARTRRLAIQFACQWLHLRNFDQNDEKNEKLYPEFAALRGDMYEETVRFFEDMFRNNGSILDLLDADHTFLNESLAKHYGVEFTKNETQPWQRVSGVRTNGRGGVLGMATFLASQSGASRTSPILRGNWLSETLLGEKLPKPPAGIPQLPEEVPTGLTARQLIEQHSSVPECAKCHARIDPYGFALEQYDVLGRIRPAVVDTKTTLLGGEKIEGLAGLRDYLLTQRRDDVVRQFCRKLLGFALGREVQLSDEPLLDTIAHRLAQNDYQFHIAVESIVLSPQFRQIRGREFSEN